MNFRLKEYREASGMSQAELANTIGKAKRTITSWEAGDSYPNAETLCKLCNIFRCTPCDMLGWWEDHERPSEGAPSLTHEETLLVDKYRSLDRRRRESVYDTVDALADKAQAQEECSGSLSEGAA